MGILKEFKEFAMKGNLIDIAVAFVMGAAFNKVVSAFTGGIVSPLIPKEDLQKIQDVLDIEVMQFKIAGFQQVGAVMTTSEKGTIVHPETDEEDMKTINNLLGGNIEAATINGGIPFVSSGILANNNSVVVGSLTNGPEIMMLTRAFLH